MKKLCLYSIKNAALTNFYKKIQAIKQNRSFDLIRQTDFGNIPNTNFIVICVINS